MENAQPTAAIAEITYDRPLSRSAIEIAIIVGLIISAASLVIVLASVGRFTRPSFQGVVLALAALVPVTLLTLFLARRRRMRRAVENILGQTDGQKLDATAATLAVLPHIRGKQYRHGLEALARGLATRGLAGSTLRIAATPGAPIEPLVVPFEPQPLDETLSDMMRAGGTSEAPASGCAAASGAAQTPAARPRPLAGVIPASLQRNIFLKGGWLLLAIFAVNWTLAALEAWRQRNWLHPPLLLWSLGLAAIVFVPVGARVTSSRQWLVVPGGLLLRSAGWRQRAWKLHLFERSRSVLCLCPSTRNQGWAVSVADGRESGTTLATPFECEFLLRAWLSPLPPPPLERLGDLA